MPPCLTLSIIRYGSKVSGAIQGKELYPHLHFSVLAIEKGAFKSLSTMFGQLLYIYYIVNKPLSIYTRTCTHISHKGVAILFIK